MTEPQPATPAELSIEPAGAHNGQAVRAVGESDTHRVEITGVYRQCRTCYAPAVAPFPRGWTLTAHRPDPDEQLAETLFFGRDRPTRSDLAPPYELTPHWPDCPAGHPIVPPAPPLPRRVPGATLAATGAVAIAPADTDPANLDAFVDVGHATGDGLTTDARPASDHRPNAAGTVAALDVDASAADRIGDLVRAVLARSSSAEFMITPPLPAGLAPFPTAGQLAPIDPATAERFRRSFEAAAKTAGEALGARLAPVVRALAESWRLAIAPHLPLMAAVNAYRARIDRGTLRAVRRSTATTRAIARRNGRRVPKRGAHLRHLRTTYRNRQ